MPIIRLLAPDEVPVALLSENTPPEPDGDSAVIGTSQYAARADHIHPKEPLDLTDSLSIINPQSPGTASPGISLKVAREDHVHPLPPLSDANPQPTGTVSPGTSEEISRGDHVHPLPFTNGPLSTNDAKIVRSNIAALGDYNKNSLEFGENNVSGARYIDFHTSGNNIDFDSRILASGGSATVGQGQLEYTAATHVFTGLITPQSSKGFKGSLGAENAQSGSIGEYITVRFPLTGLTNNTVVNVTGLTITPGDWELSASFVIQGGTDAGSTNTLYLAQAFMTSFTDRWLITGPFSSVPANAPILAGCIPRHRKLVVTNTSISLQLYTSYTAGWFAAVGEIQARRVR